ncbi:hypothetical protein Goshw_011487 [Gossypium schwendimanii]|uniref:MBD domain-containing protein n=1 Tax=Gossypium schwendimanii TaxID=34291 RepID=A0A7J9MCZ8_GOSSC|nr:hypothetical protein [Gossypium schwendimanii]
MEKGHTKQKSMASSSTVTKAENGQSSSSSSSSSKKRGRRATTILELPQPRPHQPKERSPLTIATLRLVREKAEKRGKRTSLAVSVRHFDNTDINYNWLLPGWVAEERYVPSGRKGLGRIYKYYYDTTGHKYYSKREVLFAWKKMNIICLDP